MEQAGTLKMRVSDFKSALNTLEQSLQLGLSNYKDIELDTIKSGQIQKFEYCAELCWKIIKVFLNEGHGIDTLSPKSAIKELYRIKLLDEKEYELLIQMLDDRNRLSHIYSEIYFEEIYLKLKSYLAAMKKVLAQIEKHYKS